MPDRSNPVTEALIKQRQYGTRDANFVRSLRNRTDISGAADIKQDRSPGNLAELRQEIARQTDPMRRQVLEQELNRITGLMGADAR